MEHERSSFITESIKTGTFSNDKKTIATWSKEEDEILIEKAKEYKYRNWAKVASFIKGKAAIQCSARYKRIHPDLNKGAWSEDEDKQLLELYVKHENNWCQIAKEMKTRTGKQIRDRYLNTLDKSLKKTKFTDAEDQIVIKLYDQWGKAWSKIAKGLEGRTGDMVKNRFYSSLIKNFPKEHKNNKECDRSFLRRKTESYGSTVKNCQNQNSHLIEKPQVINNIDSYKDYNPARFLHFDKSHQAPYNPPLFGEGTAYYQTTSNHNHLRNSFQKLNQFTSEKLLPDQNMHENDKINIFQCSEFNSMPNLFDPGKSIALTKRLPKNQYIIETPVSEKAMKGIREIGNSDYQKYDTLKCLLDEQLHNSPKRDNLNSQLAILNELKKNIKEKQLLLKI